MDIVQFNNIPLRDIYGDKIEKISGEYTADELGVYLTKMWVAYVECHQCSREDTCEFVQPHPHWKHRKKEIRCGVKSKFITNLINLVFSEFMDGDDNTHERLLSGIFYLSEFIFKAEHKIGMALSSDWLNYLEGYASNSILSIVHLRELLNNAAGDFAFIPSLYDKKPILLVEGESEKAFIDKLKESHLSWFSDLRVEVYGGNGNCHPRRIQMRLNKYIEDGYTCYMQGDKDGKELNVFNKLIKQGVVKAENTFLFENDFESSIPPNLLLNVIKSLGYLTDVSEDDFLQNIDQEKSICKTLEVYYDFDINSYKVALADELGWFFNNSYFSWYNDESNFMETTELGQFLDFIIKMH